MKSSKGKISQKTFLIGISSDKGKTWTFINGDLDIKRVKSVFPNLPEKLKLPDKEKPVLENDGK
jgi:hypothetical protein